MIIWIATAASTAAGTYCASSNSPHFAHIWITIFKMIVTVVAIVAVFRFHGRMKAQLAPHKIFLKFFAFKGIIGINLIQTVSCPVS
jgi:membrane protein YdbS with pleckstrin-like domain